jgi:hypothetical protein
VGPVEILALELVGIRVCVLIGLVETNVNADGVVVGDDSRAGIVGEDDSATSALL